MGNFSDSSMKFFSDFMKLDEFIRGGIGSVFLAACFAMHYFYVLSNPPLTMASKFEHGVARLNSVDVIRKSTVFKTSVSFYGHDKRSELFFDPSVVEVKRSNLEFNIGKDVELLYFGSNVVSCTAGGKQLCWPRCRSADECSWKIVNDDLNVLLWMIYLLLFCGGCCFCVYILNKLKRS